MSRRDVPVIGPMHTEVELHVADVERSLTFYTALGFVVTRRWEDWIRLERDGAALVLFGDAYVRSRDHYFTPFIDRAPRGVGVEIVIEVEDIEAARAAADVALTAIAGGDAASIGGGADVVGGGTQGKAAARLVKDITERDWKARDFRLADPDGFFLRFTTPLRR